MAIIDREPGEFVRFCDGRSVPGKRASGARAPTQVEVEDQRSKAKEQGAGAPHRGLWPLVFDLSVRRVVVPMTVFGRPDAVRVATASGHA